MAAGDTLLIFTPLHNEPPSSNAATFDTRNAHPVLDYDAATDEHAVFTGVLPRHYGAGGITITLFWAASSAVADNVVWNTAFERIDEEGLDIDADSFAAAKSVTDVAPDTSGKVAYAAIAHANNELDGLLVGELFRLKVTRDADNASDNMAGDAELLAVHLRETPA